MASTTLPRKPVHSLIIDTGPLIKNAIAVSTLLQQAEELYTTPAILDELRSEAVRTWVQTSLLPFLNVRSPSPASYDAVVQFSKKTGDFAVLSRQDLSILALAYEIECERSGGNWRLRSTPGQKHLNGAPPKHDSAAEAPTTHWETTAAAIEPTSSDVVSTAAEAQTANLAVQPASEDLAASVATPSNDSAKDTSTAATVDIEREISKLDISSPHDHSAAEPGEDPEPPLEDAEESEEEEDDGDGEWITPSNIRKRQAKDAGSSKTSEPKNMAVATITTDFAMQNVLLQMNLNLLSTNMQRIKNLKTWILRCHACFFTTKQMEKQFCPRCGQPTLRRVSCSTNAKGEFKLHLKKNYQWNTRGDRYSIPKPVGGSANGRVNVGGGGKGGGKGGWGQNLILAEDQKEYTKAEAEQKRSKTRDLMDEDYLPGILTGDRGRAGGRTKVGAGKNVNSRKRF